MGRKNHEIKTKHNQISWNNEKAIKSRLHEQTQTSYDPNHKTWKMPAYIEQYALVLYPLC